MEERLQKLENHVREHPTDYQSVIALYKLRSDNYSRQMKQRQIAKLRKIAKYRRELNGGESEQQ